MTLDSEAAVKKALGIGSFREMSKEKMLAFAATMPDMAKEVRLKLVEQIPAFRDFALHAVDVAEEVFIKEVDANRESTSALRDSLADIRDALKSELARDDISEEHRRYLTEKLIENGQFEAAIVSEGNQFLAAEATDTRRTNVALAGISVIAAVILAGGTVMVKRGLDSTDDSDDANEEP